MWLDCMPRKPNFFIVGAPKCGTTALSEYLREHPRVFVSGPQEPHFFATDLPRLQIVKSETDYLKLFVPAAEMNDAVGEASAMYLYSQKAIENIHVFDGAAKVIVMLRNPVDLAYSMHSQMLYSRDEDVAEFELAWQLIEKRKHGSNIPRQCRDTKLLIYDEIAKLGEQLLRLTEKFSKEQVKIIFFEDFASDTADTYRDTLNFLGVPDDNRTEFPRIKPNRRHTIGWLANFTQRPPSVLLNIAMRAKVVLGVKRLGAFPLLRKLNVVEKPRPPLAVNFARQIAKTFQSDIELLSKLTGRDLSRWMDPI